MTDFGARQVFAARQVFQIVSPNLPLKSILDGWFSWMKAIFATDLLRKMGFAQGRLVVLLPQEVFGHDRRKQTTPDADARHIDLWAEQIFCHDNNGKKYSCQFCLADF